MTDEEKIVRKYFSSIKKQIKSALVDVGIIGLCVFYAIGEYGEGRLFRGSMWTLLGFIIYITNE